MEDSKYPPGWDEDRLRRLMDHCERQNAKEAAAEDETAFEGENLALIQIPEELTPTVCTLITDYEREGATST
ncbi:MAG: hypothetical protein JW993_09700 [Sedimentisphaerales bacterium]|nr:hypothetical protein [Sedimentisphaerales bacterium]